MQKRNLSADDAGILVLLAATILGTWLRLVPAWMAGFPVNDGGMFYTMILDLQKNQYILPLFTTYNNLDIPFVYPPLAFYIGAAISDLFKLTSPLPVIQWLPGVFNALCIPAFYLLARNVLDDKLQGAISTLVFALIPHMTAWFSMGGGLTRALGAFFMLLALSHIFRVFAKESRKDIWGAVIFSSLATLSHTEAPIYTIAIAIYIWAMTSRSKKGLLNGILIAIGVLVLSFPWLGWILSNHGTAPLISASQTGLHSTWSVLRLLNVDVITEEPYLDLLGASGIFGMAILASRRNFFLPGMLAVIFLSNPRSAHTIANIPLAMAAGFFICDILMPAVKKMQETPFGRFAGKISGLMLFIAILTPFVLGNSLYHDFLLSEKHVSTSGKDAMRWVEENTPADRAFLLITGEPNGFCDSTSEWFPALTKRRSLSTLQGNEWLKGDDFGEFVRHLQKIQACGLKGLDCLLQEMDRYNSDFDYLYVSLDSPTSNCTLTDTSVLAHGLVFELERSDRFQEVYRADGALIFEKK